MMVMIERRVESLRMNKWMMADQFYLYLMHILGINKNCGFFESVITVIKQFNHQALTTYISVSLALTTYISVIAD